MHAIRKVPVALRRYPWRAVLLAMAGLAIAFLICGTAINAAFDQGVRRIDPRYTALSGTCYFAGDARHYMRIALNGYSDYDPALMPLHYSQPNDRGWWPLFPALAAGALALGGGECSGLIVNGLAFVLLVPVFQALTGHRRALSLMALALLPFGAWLYVGSVESLLLLLSGLLVLAARAGERRPRAAALLALVIGVLVGLTDVRGLFLVPALALWSLGLTAARLWIRPEDDPRPTLRLVLEDASPAWAPLLGALGVALGTAAWLYQGSGHYPLWPLMIHRQRVPDDFIGWSLSSFAYTFDSALRLAWRGLLSMQALERSVQVAVMVFALALAFARIPPLWPSTERIVIPASWRIGILTLLLAMFASGQSYGLERAAAANIFVALAWHRLVFGMPDQPVTWSLLSFTGIMRWLWLLAGPALWLLSYLLLGWQPVNG